MFEHENDASEKKFLEAREAARKSLLPYWECDVVEGVKETRALSSVDTDGTRTVSDGEPSRKEIAEREEANRWLRKEGPIVGSSARTFEISVSDALYRASLLHGVTRPEPHFGVDENGRRVFVRVEELLKFKNCLDPDGFCGFGTQIYLRHKSYYDLDLEYTRLLGNWRADALSFLSQVDLRDRQSRLLDVLADIEDENNYYAGKSDVYPPEYRIQLEWTIERHGKNAEEEKNNAKKKIRFWQHLFRPSKTWSSGAKRIDLVDESNPKQGRYVLYMVPRRSTKELMLNRMIHKVAEAANMVPSQLSMFVAGDTMTDVRAGFYAGLGTNVTFLLAGGSRLYPHLSPHGKRAGQPHAGEPLKEFTRLLASGLTEHKGVYRFRTPTLLGTVNHRIKKVYRTVIIADEAFPGEVGPASIAAYLENIRKIEKA